MGRFRRPTNTLGFVLLVAGLTGCAGQTGPPLGSSPPSGSPVSPTGTATLAPQYNELTIDRTSGPAPTVPWQLIRVDHQENRIYLSASTTGCTAPEKVRVTESVSSIRITVTGTSGSEPCTMQ